jgi:4'-phosphopantetheinyl transferase
LLHESERARAFEIGAELRRGRFVSGRATLRRILARYVALGPADVRFDYDWYGKPRLAHTRDVEFNLSHSGTRALLAVARGTVVGVDIEHIREGRRHEAIMERFFSAREQGEVLRLPPERRAEGFYLAWVAREALVKALGRGVLTPRLVFPDMQVRRATLDLDGRFAAAICWRGGRHRLVWRSVVTIGEKSNRELRI